MLKDFVSKLEKAEYLEFRREPRTVAILAEFFQPNRQKAVASPTFGVEFQDSPLNQTVKTGFITLVFTRLLLEQKRVRR